MQQAALKNEMLDVYINVIQDPKNRTSILTPISMKNLKGDVVNGVDVDNSVFGQIAKDMGLEIKEGHGELYQVKDLSDPLDLCLLRKTNNG